MERAKTFLPVQLGLVQAKTSRREASEQFHPAMKAGDFSPLCRWGRNQIPIYDPQDRATLSGNIIPRQPSAAG